MTDLGKYLGRGCVLGSVCLVRREVWYEAVIKHFFCVNKAGGDTFWLGGRCGMKMLLSTLCKESRW